MITSDILHLLADDPVLRKMHEEAIRLHNKHRLLALLHELTEQDIKILVMIYNVQMANAWDIGKVVWKNNENLHYARRHATRRLLKLYKLGVVDRFIPKVFPGASTKYYVLTTIGVKVLERKLSKELPFEQITKINQKWRHTLGMGSVFAEVYRNLNGVDWETEIKTSYLRADALLGYEGHYYFIELDLGTEHQSILNKKVNQYLQYFISEEIKTANWQPYKNFCIIPKVLFICNDKKRITELQFYIDDFKRRFNVKFDFLVSDLDNFIEIIKNKA